MALPPKPFLRLDEICARWSVTPRDIADYALAGAITLSVPVVRLRVETGTYEEVGDGDWHRLPDGYRTITGTVDLYREDAWTILKEGERPVSRFQAPDNDYMIVGRTDDTDSLTVAVGDLVVRQEEVARFERSWQDRDELTGSGGSRAIPRGAPPRFDWDAFWVEVCRRTHDEGLPPTQSALVRGMLDWFAVTGEAVPDSSTVKKKLALLWRSLRRSA